MPRHDDWDDFGAFPPPSQPRRVKGGIKAQSQRGTFGQSWWAKRWIGVLESFDLGSRLARGRSYARNGQVLDITIAAGHVGATVQGSQTKPYTVAMAMQQLSAEEWQRVVQAIGEEALFVAHLLNGVMPQEIESAFAAANVSLFPARLDDITTACSCPDWSNPCKHSAAVYYLLGEEFDRDPFLLFALRGMDRAHLLVQVGTFQGTTPSPTATPALAPAALAPEPLPGDPLLFWGEPVAESPETGDIAPLPPVVAALPKRLGHFPFWRGEDDIQASLATMYQTAAQLSRDLLSGERYHKEIP